MLYKSVFAEYIGTLLFLLVVLIGGKPILIAGGLLIVLLLIGSISGGHVNPAISTIMFVKGDLNLEKYILYVIAQILGGLTALSLFPMIKKNIPIKY